MEQLSPNFDYRQLMYYFLRTSLITQLPNVQMMDCISAADLIIKAMGGSENAKSLWVAEDSHQYVINKKQSDIELAYNNTLGLNRTVGWVKRHGK